MYIDQVRLGPHAHKEALFLSFFFNSLAWTLRDLCTQMHVFLGLEISKDGVRPGISHIVGISHCFPKIALLDWSISCI